MSYNSQDIFLYTTPLRDQKTFLRMKKPVDVIGHWAVCIDGVCYELTRGEKARNEPKYLPKYTPEDEWIGIKTKEGRGLVKELAGRMAAPYSRETIEATAEQIWETSLQKIFVFDQQNCQVFIRLLFELIGDQETKARFPQFFDEWVYKAGMTRDYSLLAAAGFGIGAAGSAISASLDFGVVSTGATAALGASAFGALATTSVIKDRVTAKKRMEKSQAKIKGILKSKGYELL